ncbi:MAG: ABC transporter ATP-binding protein [Betaproteobacteria bacterium]|nr:ABC transporter ATP-binding protein [Betaproteobacteria bacterium]
MGEASQTGCLVDARNLEVEFAVGQLGRRQRVRAIDGLSLAIRRAEIVALVGESGCGKSTTGRVLLRLCRPSAGQIKFDGVDITAISQRAMRPMRQRMQMVFQHPGQALNPRVRIGNSVGEPLEAAGFPPAERRARVQALLGRVGLNEKCAAQYPHELSGGQLQRIAIARALIGHPDFVVADEPLSSLDLSVQAQVMILLRELQAEFGISLLFITHDLAVAEYLSNRVAVMYMGKMVEMAPAKRFSGKARHPYSKALLASIPRMDPVHERNRPSDPLPGEVPSMLNPPAGCRFHTRCPMAEARCRIEEPPLEKIDHDHEVACWLVRA